MSRLPLGCEWIDCRCEMLRLHRQEHHITGRKNRRVRDCRVAPVAAQNRSSEAGTTSQATNWSPRSSPARTQAWLSALAICPDPMNPIRTVASSTPASPSVHTLTTKVPKCN